MLRHLLFAFLFIGTFCFSIFYARSLLYIALLVFGYVTWLFVAHMAGDETTRAHMERIANMLHIPPFIHTGLANMFALPEVVARRPAMETLICRDSPSTSSASTHIPHLVRARGKVAGPMFTPGRSSLPEMATSSVQLASTSSTPMMRDQADTLSKSSRSHISYPREIGMSFQTSHSVAGPALASTRFKQNLDFSVYADVSSPGFTDRVAKYHLEANSDVPGSRYSTPGQYPSVRLAKDQVPTVRMDLRPKMRSPVTVRLPSLLPVYQPSSSSPIVEPTSDKSPDNAPTHSVLDALKEISRKRIRGGSLEEDSEATKKLKSDERDIALGLIPIERSPSPRPTNPDVSSKRSREESPESQQVQPQKRSCKNEIRGSYSSASKGKNKRKAEADDFQETLIPVLKNKKIIISLISDEDSQPQISGKVTSPPGTASSFAKICATPGSSKTAAMDLTKSMDTDKVEASQAATCVERSSLEVSTTPIKPPSGKMLMESLFGVTSPESEEPKIPPRRPKYATEIPEETSKSPSAGKGHELRAKKLKDIFSALQRREEEKTKMQPVPSAPAASLTSSTTLTTSITSPVVSVSQLSIPNPQVTAGNTFQPLGVHSKTLPTLPTVGILPTATLGVQLPSASTSSFQIGSIASTEKASLSTPTALTLTGAAKAATVSKSITLPTTLANLTSTAASGFTLSNAPTMANLTFGNQAAANTSSASTPALSTSLATPTGASLLGRLESLQSSANLTLGSTAKSSNRGSSEKLLQNPLGAPSSMGLPTLTGQPSSLAPAASTSSAPNPFMMPTVSPTGFSASTTPSTKPVSTFSGGKPFTIDASKNNNIMALQSKGLTAEPEAIHSSAKLPPANPFIPTQTTALPDQFSSPADPSKQAFGTGVGLSFNQTASASNVPAMFSAATITNDPVNVFGAPPNQSPFQSQNPAAATSNTSTFGFGNPTTSANPVGGFSFPLSFSSSDSAPEASAPSASSTFGFGAMKPAESSTFSFGAPANKPDASVGFPQTAPQATFSFGGGNIQQSQSTMAFGGSGEMVNPFGAPAPEATAASTSGFNFGAPAAASANLFQFGSGGSAPQQPAPQAAIPSGFNFGSIPNATATDFGATIHSLSPYPFGGPSGGMFSIGTGASRSSRSTNPRRRKPN